MPQTGLGKVRGIFGASPAFLQRAAAVSVLSLLFFLLMMLGFYIRRNIGYFLLATAFLAVNVLTLVGWLAFRKRTVRIYENGIEFRNFRARWDEIESVELSEENTVGGAARQTARLAKRGGESVEIPNTIGGLREIVALVESGIAGAKS